MAQQVNLSLVTLATHIRAPVGISVLLLLIQSPAGVPKKALKVAQVHAPRTWTPCTHEGDMDRVLGFWLQPGPTPSCCGLLGSEPVKTEYLSFTAFQVNK